MQGNYDVARHHAAFANRQQMLPISAGIARRIQKLVGDAEKREFHPQLHAQLRSRQAAVLGGGLASNILVSLLLAVYFSKNLTSRLATLADNTERLAREQNLNPELGGNDEISQIDTAFHKTAKALVTARKKERAVFDNSQDLICVIDREGRIISTNPACERLLHYEKEEFCRQNLFDLTFDEDRDAVRKLLTLDSGEACIFESRLQGADGNKLWLSWSISKDKMKEHWYCVAHDVSNRKELEQLKQEFLAMVSHDLRTPLTSITGIAKLIIAGAFGKIEEPSLFVLQEITREGDRLLELINDLLDIEKLEAGKMQLLFERSSLSELLRRCVSRKDPAGANIDLQLCPDDTAFDADQDRFLQAIGNVIGFALRFKQEGSKLRISYRASAEGLELEITASNLRIGSKQHEKLFDRFAANDDGAEPGREAENAESGLALPIARSIIEGHGGKIRLKTGPDGADMFWICVPRRQGQCRET